MFIVGKLNLAKYSSYKRSQLIYLDISILKVTFILIFLKILLFFYFLIILNFFCGIIILLVKLLKIFIQLNGFKNCRINLILFLNFKKLGK